MMSWYYAIIVTATEHGDLWSLHEVYQDEDGALSWTENPVDFGGFDDKANLVWSLQAAANDATRRPVFRLRDGRLEEFSYWSKEEE